MAERQLEFTPNRYTLQEWLRCVQIPRFERERDGEKRLARTSRIKQMLKVIEEHSWKTGSCRMLTREIAREMNVTERTVGRVLTDCEQLKLLYVDRSKNPMVKSLFAIDWSVVGEMILACPETCDVIEKRLKSGDKKLPSFVENEGTEEAETPDNLAETPDNLAETPDNLAETPDNLAGVSGNRTSLPASAPARALNHSLIHHDNTSWKNDGLKTDEKPKTGGWPFRITLETLSSRSKVQQLWDWARSQAWGIPAEKRIQFFALARCVARMKREGIHPIDDVGAVFTTELKRATNPPHYRWNGTLADEDAARRAIEILDGRAVGVGYNPMDE